MKKKSLIFFILFLIGIIFFGFIAFLFIAIKPLPYKRDANPYPVINLTDQFDINVVSENPSLDRTNHLYHYIKSNQDGSNSADVWIYYPEAFKSESFKIYKQSGSNLDLVCSEYDDNFQSSKLTAYFIDKNANLYVNAEAVMENEIVHLNYRGKLTDDVYNGIIPSYNINFDLADMISMFPYLKNKQTDFSFGLNNVYFPNRFSYIKLMLGVEKKIEMYVGKVVCYYKGEELHNNFECYVYDLVVDGYEYLDGKIYVDVNDYSVVEINTKNVGNPGFNSFKFELIEKAVMTE